MNKLNVNASQEEPTVTKKIWVKPTVEIISVETGTLTSVHEGSTIPALRFRYHS